MRIWGSFLSTSQLEPSTVRPVLITRGGEKTVVTSRLGLQVRLIRSSRVEAREGAYVTRQRPTGISYRELTENMKNGPMMSVPAGLRRQSEGNNTADGRDAEPGLAVAHAAHASIVTRERLDMP